MSGLFFPSGGVLNLGGFPGVGVGGRGGGDVFIKPRPWAWGVWDLETPTEGSSPGLGVGRGLLLGWGGSRTWLCRKDADPGERAM